ncbi:hypothetical protein DKT77_00920 [Meridianimarinicoccus roseus]|uniref:DUF3329 domain-containing protein n=1 Tax=Meridianimarinicoccus roseus TaxID=2072018 RepID=A0A2V2LG03_9RHOB|nr:hypothetical protein [Meridianimarinicoccus roseus]PWR04560.1 hypothetical protein DKT77_00920 [Meridianimarinicoccus roseus]
MFDTGHPWFRPLWRRVVLALVTGGWALVELAGGNTGWALVFMALAGWVVWALLVTYAPEGGAAGNGNDGATPPGAKDDDGAP